MSSIAGGYGCSSVLGVGDTVALKCYEADLNRSGLGAHWVAASQNRRVLSVHLNSMVKFCRREEATDEITINSLARDPDNSVELRMTGVLFLGVLYSPDGRYTQKTSVSVENESTVLTRNIAKDIKILFQLLNSMK